MLIYSDCHKKMSVLKSLTIPLMLGTVLKETMSHQLVIVDWNYQWAGFNFRVQKSKNLSNFV